MSDRTCPHCGLKMLEDMRWSTRFACGTTTYKDGPSSRSEACQTIATLRSELDRLSAQGGEVPEISYEAFAEIMDTTELIGGVRDREKARRERITKWFRANSRPAPPHPDTVPRKTNRQMHEEAAGMGLEEAFFRMNGIDPDAYPDTVEVSREEWALLERMIEIVKTNKEYPYSMRNKLVAVVKILDALRAQPSATPPRDTVEVSKEAYRWIPVGESLPEDGESVGFIAKCSHDAWNHGRSMGGKFHRKSFDEGFGGFTTPGVEWGASHWCRFPSIPDALRAQAQPATEREGDHA